MPVVPGYLYISPGNSCWIFFGKRISMVIVDAMAINHKRNKIPINSYLYLDKRHYIFVCIGIMCILTVSKIKETK